MKLKSRLRISTGIAVVLSIITGIITMFVSNNINEMSAKNIYLDEISKATFELSIITDEYFISRGEDTKQEWLRKYDDIGNSLQSERLMFKDPGCVSIMNLLTDVHEKLGGDFAAIDKMDMRKSGTEDITGLSADVKNRYADSLFEKLSTIVFQADRLEDLNHSNMISIQNKAVFLTAFSILFMTLIVFALMVVIEKTVINPVIRLKKAIGDIASGKMDHHSVSTHTRDEIGELSGSFDELSRKLKTTMVSRDKLAEEIAERIKAEKALHLSESKHRELIKNIPQKIFYKDKDSRYILCNESYASDLGMTPEELVGKTDYDLYPKELARKYREDDKSVLSSGTIREVDEKYIKDGKEAQVHTVKTPVKDGNGDVTGLFGIFWDITYRKQSEKEILELSKFPSENPNPVLRVKKDGTILYANKSGRALLDFYGLETGRIMPPDLKRDIEEISRTGRNSILELKIYDRIFEIAVTPVKGSDYVNMYGRDISERKRSEEELRKSEERYALAEEAAKVGSWDWDIQKGLLYWSDRIEPMFGFEPGEFGRTYEAFLECIHPEDRQHVMDAVDESLKNGSDYNIEHRIIWPDQSIHWVSEKGNVYFGEPSGKPVRMIGLVQDITDRKNGEEELRKAVNIKSTFTSMVSHELRTPLA